ncbi:MAG TPA: ring-cleaving dioxygenase [Thermohalobaculum sp.]|nr:ring-cleaving dioxygenase [Thermohalobaculum sp.]
MQLRGIHHLTAITADASGNHAFYTTTLGLRLVKKTVNQDDVSAYHLFYADGIGSPGTDITFFDWPLPRGRRGTSSIVRTAFRVAGERTLGWWHARLRSEGVTLGEVAETDGRATLEFEDPEGQRLALIDDGGAGEAHPWEASPVPAEHQIRGLGPITLSVPALESTETVLREVMGMRKARRYGGDARPVHVFEMGDGGPGAELHVAVEPDLPAAGQGAGAVHHVAFRTPDDEYDAWARRLEEMHVASSGPIDRFYFRSLYFREPNGILFEIASDGPGFAADEPQEHLGESLSLPPFLEHRRAEIEAGLKPL